MWTSFVLKPFRFFSFLMVHSQQRMSVLLRRRLWDRNKSFSAEGIRIEVAITETDTGPRFCDFYSLTSSESLAAIKAVAFIIVLAIAGVNRPHEGWDINPGQVRMVFSLASSGWGTPPPPQDRLRLDRLCRGRYTSCGFPQEDCLVC